MPGRISNQVTPLIALLAIGLQEPDCKVSASVLETRLERVRVMIRFDIEPGWHIYWKNPGDSGEPTSIRWTLPEGWKAGELKFPTPKAFDTGGIINYGYENNVTLVTDLYLPSGLTPGKIQGEALYLICKEACIPGSRKFTVDLSAPPAAPAAGEAALAALPKPFAGKISSAYREGNLALTFEGMEVEKAYFFADGQSVVDHSAPQRLERAPGGYRLLVPLSPYTKERPEKVTGVLALTNTNQPTRGFAIETAPTKTP